MVDSDEDESNVDSDDIKHRMDAVSNSDYHPSGVN